MKHVNGPGKLLIFVYGLFALSATARASVQIISDWSTAPLAYGLSALAGVIYIVATIALARESARARLVAWWAVSIELIGVLGVGIFSFIQPEAFPEASVWSHLGQGYGYIPLVLPVFGLAWLRHTTKP